MDAEQGELGRTTRSQDDTQSACIQEDIGRTRARMDRTVALIQDRLSFGRIADDLGVMLVENAGAGSRRVLEGIRKNPIPAGLVGLGIAWLIAEKARARQHAASPYYSQPADRPTGAGGPHIGERIAEGVQEGIHRAKNLIHEAGEQVSAAAGAARKGIADVGDTIRHTGQDIGHTASNWAGQARHAAENVAGQARHAAGEARQTVVKTYEDNPLVVGAATFALGLIGGLLVPTTSVENRLMGKASKDLKNRAKNMGEQALEAGERIANRVAQGAKEGASTGSDIGERVVHAAESAASAAAQEFGRAAQTMIGGRRAGEQGREPGRPDQGRQAGPPPYPGQDSPATGHH